MGNQIGDCCCPSNPKPIDPPEIVAPVKETVKENSEKSADSDVNPESPSVHDEAVPYEIVEEPLLTEQQKKLYKGQQSNQTESFQKCYKILATDCKQLYEYLVYCGSFKKGKAHGPGRIHTSDGYYLEGTFQNGDLHPQVSKFVYPDGTYFTGRATGSLPHFRIKYVTGEIHYPDGSYFKGDFLENKQHGKNCTYYDSKTKVTFKGEWEDDLPHGKISQQENGLVKWQGTYDRGQREHGRLFATMGAQFVTGYTDNVPNGPGKVFFASKQLDVEHHNGNLVKWKTVNSTI